METDASTEVNQSDSGNKVPDELLEGAEDISVEKDGGLLKVGHVDMFLSCSL